MVFCPARCSARLKAATQSYACHENGQCGALRRELCINPNGTLCELMLPLQSWGLAMMAITVRIEVCIAVIINDLVSTLAHIGL